ncbi:MAG: penicillin-binding transpeptidase domain-containing protein, partial [Oscillospiraceae bacterium]
MSDKPTSSMKRRLNVIVALVLVAFTVWIIINLVNVSIKDSETYQNMANNQQFQSRVINANRGNILDKNGNILASSATVYTVFIDPVMVKKNDSDKLELICEKLASILDIEADFVKTQAEKSSRCEYLKKKVEKEVADEVNAFIAKEELSCIGVDPDAKRIYPHNDLAASVIGFTGYDGNGIYGLEKYYDEYLTGINGKIITAKDGRGAEMPYRYEQNYSAQDGNTLVLNIDIVLQYYVEKELKKAVEEHGANNRACAIIMNVKTGQILAMATEPDFDLNNPTEIFDPTVAAAINAITDEDEKQTATAIAWDKQWKNKAISELYYPGSVFKVITGSAALEEKAISLTDIFTCTGSITVGGETFNCWSNKAHGDQNFVEAMTHSCNPAFVQIGQRLGIHNFCKYFSAYGL